MYYVQPKLNLRELGLADLGVQQLDDLVNHVLPYWGPQDTPFLLGGQTVWKTFHMSSHSFFCNKHGETVFAFFLFFFTLVLSKANATLVEVPVNEYCEPCVFITVIFSVPRLPHWVSAHVSPLFFQTAPFTS